MAVMAPAICFAEEVVQYPYLDASLPLDERVADLVSRLTLEEKASLMMHHAPAVERLGIPAYNWWNEALHGVARSNEKMTSFPQAIALAATFDTEAMQTMADMISSEGRAIYNEKKRAGGPIPQYYGLTYWTPNINIFRDPRWGRGQETYGEDPYLTGKMGAAMVRGLEGNDPDHLKSVACAKHYAVHSGPESSRHVYDARPSAYDLWDTYLPAFKELVVDAGVHGVMCAYNRLDGEPCCGNDPLLGDILRNQWGFDGYITSDCGAISNFAHDHKTSANDTEAAATAVLAGTDLECGDQYSHLVEAVERGIISERDMDVSLKRLFKILFKLGMFDPAALDPYSGIGREVVECDAHKEHALKMARESMVLLKNSKSTLPLNAAKIKRIALIGPNADNGIAQLANYNGFPTEISTPYSSLKKRFGDKVKIDYYKGTGVVDKDKDGPTFKQIAAAASKADVIIFVGGIDSSHEGEEGDANMIVDGFYRGDRTSMALPKVQVELLKELKKTGKPLVLVNMSGSVINFDWEARNADAILQAWYGGQAAGDAIVDVLFGEYNPAGRMPLTTYVSDDDLPAFEDYSMANRTYRYFRGPVRYPFGYGLSYTMFDYGQINAPEQAATGNAVTVSAKVKNAGKRDGDEVVQLYVVHPQDGTKRVPLCALKGFKRVNLKAGEEQTVEFTLQPADLGLVDYKGNLVQTQGDVQIFIGGGQPGHAEGVTATVAVAGEPYRAN